MATANRKAELLSVLKQFLVIFVLGALGGAAWYLSQPEPAATDGAETARAAESAAVIVERATMAAERIRLEAVGTARARRSIMLRPETAGEVTAVRFEADQMVEKGDTLVTLRQDAEALDVELARVRLADAQRTFDRLDRLSKSGTTTQAALDEARTALQSARIALRQAEVALDDRSVRAPFTGRIGLTDVEVGNRIDQDTEIATLDDRNILLIRFDVPEALLGRVQVGSAVSVAPWSGEGSTDGYVVDVDSRIDDDSRTFAVRAEMPNPDDRFRPGMSFRVTLDLFGRSWPSVPEIAIQWGGSGSYLWTVRDETAIRVPVTIVQRQAAGVLVEADLDEGAPVVVEGLHRLRDGRPVSATLREPPVAKSRNGATEQ